MTTTEPNLTENAGREATTIVADVAIVGGGLAGSLAAAVLTAGRISGCARSTSALFIPRNFVSKNLADSRSISCAGSACSMHSPKEGCAFDTTLNIRQGKLVDVSRGMNYGLPYAPMVAIARRQIDRPIQSDCRSGSRYSASDDLQRLTLASGNQVVARLVILATGMAGAIPYRLGIKRRVLASGIRWRSASRLRRRMVPSSRFPLSTSYGEQTADGIDYLSIFPDSGGGMRANLFMFRDPNDPIMREIRREPKSTLLRLMPGLRSHLGDFKVIDRVQNWVMDLANVEGHLQPGIVLIGDSFQTSCPAAGTGVSRLLVDVERLCTVHLPEWLKTDGMGTEKISTFYSDREQDRLRRTRVQDGPLPAGPDRRCAACDGIFAAACISCDEMLRHRVDASARLDRSTPGMLRA